MNIVKFSRRIQQGLWEIERKDNGAIYYMAIANNRVTFISPLEEEARLWLSRCNDDPTLEPA